jgi:site-specific DNA-methyltransferase (adenine-specific)
MMLDTLKISTAQHSRAVMSSSKDMTWETPAKWFEYLDLEFDFTLDPCCYPETAKCRRYFTPIEDGLSQSWKDERVFMNPPYGREIGPWMKKAYEEARYNGALVVCFVPARVDTEWWHQYAAKGEVRFPKGRVTFAGAEAPAPFPVAVVIFRSKLNP